MDKKELKPVYSTTIFFGVDDQFSCCDMEEPSISEDGRLRVCADFAKEYFGVETGSHEIEIYAEDAGPDSLKICAPPYCESEPTVVAVQRKDGKWEYEEPHVRTALFLHKLSIACKTMFLWVQVYELPSGQGDADDSEFFKALESMSQ